MTNGDYIRQMPDEELEKILLCPYEADRKFPFPECFEDNSACTQCVIDFLKKEREKKK